VARRLVGVLAFLVASVSVPAHAGRQFTVAEEIGLAHFGDAYTGQAEALQFSPDGTYVAALTERGRLDLDRPEDTLRIYRIQDLLAFLRRSNDREPPTPVWAFSRSTDKDGPIVTHWRWLADSSGIAFLERGAHGSNRLILADVNGKAIKPLTPDGANVEGYDIRDRGHYVYAVRDPGMLLRDAAESQAAAIVGTGRMLVDLLLPVDQNPETAFWSDRSQLWAAIGAMPFPVMDQAGGNAVVLFSEGQRNLALSPDGESLVTALPVAEIPVAWVKLYPPPFEASPSRLRAGKQDLATFSGYGLVSRYVHIDLRSGAVRALTEGPTGIAAGWAYGAAPVWSQDGRSVVLPGGYVAAEQQASPRACVAVADLNPLAISCVAPIEGQNESGAYSDQFHFVESVRLESPDGRKLHLGYVHNNGDRGSTSYHRSAGGRWVVAALTGNEDWQASKSLTVTVKQGLNRSPVLMATDGKTKVSRVIWDPNPQLKDIVLGDATVYRWKDKSGREWKGGLFRPVPLDPNHRYPLVIQTHGFAENEFRPSGIYPTAFAARALAGAGLVVLQAQDCPIIGTPEEGPCNVGGYEAAVSQLVEAGLVDPDRIGIIGFSRTCLHVMEALTASSLRIRAASVTDGVMAGYLQYMTWVDSSGGRLGGDLAAAYDALVGARPFGEGLQEWLRRSPLFHMDKVNAALQVVALGRADLTFMWEPYAAMRYLNKPVDFILLNNDAHVLSNPSARLASQGGAVDWMRFWLQDYEDPAPKKESQYIRWRELRRLRDAQHENY